MSQTAEQLDQENNDIATEIKAKLGKVGLHDGIPNELYHRSVGISKSGLDVVRRSPYHYKFLRENPKPATPAMVLGSALHALVLEGEDVFNEQFIKDPGIDRRTKEGKVLWSQLVQTGKILISDKKDTSKGVWGMSDWETIHRMRDSIMSHPIASVLLSSGTAERTGYWVDPETKKLCKFRMDWYNDTHNLIVDLKSTLDASMDGFSRSVAEFNYDMQDSFYRTGMEVIGNPVDEFVFIAIEKEPPFAVSLYTLVPKAKHRGMLMYRRALDTYARCHNDDEWPCYPIEPRDLDIPAYSYNVKIY